MNSLRLFFLSILFLSFNLLYAQTELNDNGEVHSYGFDVGTDYTDLVIPTNVDPRFNRLTLTLKGGDGGRRKVPNICIEPGGNGARVAAHFPIGDGDNELRPGGRIRIIVGQRGGNNTSGGLASGGGGGGTAILYLPPNLSGNGDCSIGEYSEPSVEWDTTCFILLAVAGGGGGAYAAASCSGSNSGKPGNAGTSGTDGRGATPGLGGSNGRPGAPDNGDEEDRFSNAGAGYKGFDAEFVTGKYGELTGGEGGGSNELTNRGGFGYGGGGSGWKGPILARGGGGGGFSGGGFGSQYNGGGGGGSFANPYASSSRKRDGNGTDKKPDSGYATYQFTTDVNEINAPNIECQDVTVYLSDDDTQLTPDSTIVSVSDPNGIPLDIRICEVGLFDCPVNYIFNCNDIGHEAVYTLKVDNGFKASYCAFYVDVVESNDGQLVCPESFTVEIDDCVAYIENNRDYFGTTASLQVETLPACDVDLDFSIIRPDGTTDNNFEIVDNDLGVTRDTFEFGTSTLLYRAAYLDGDDLERLQTCSFTVTVDVADFFDLTCPNDQEIEVDQNDVIDPCSLFLEDTGNPFSLVDLTLDEEGCGTVSYTITGPGLSPVIAEGDGLLEAYTFSSGLSTIEYALELRPGTVYTCSFTVNVDQSGADDVEFTTCPDDDAPLLVYEGITEEELLDQLDFEATSPCGIASYAFDEPIEIDCNDDNSRQRDIRIVATSNIGRTGNCTFDVRTTGNDRVLCPDDIIVELAENECAATLTDGTLAQLNGCSDPADYVFRFFENNELTDSGTGNFPSQEFTPGEYLVIYRIPSQSECRFDIIVSESIAPQAICGEVTVGVFSATDSLPYRLAEASTDNCTDTLRFSIQETINCDMIGTQAVVVTVTDESGNSSICEAVLTVDDESRTPTITSCPPIRTINALNECNVFVPNLLNQVDMVTNCEASRLEQMPEAGAFVDVQLGDSLELTFTLFYDEVQLAISTCTVKLGIVIDDTEGPVISCPDATVALDETGNVNIAAIDLVSSATDACSPNITASMDQTAYSCDDLGTREVFISVTDGSGNSRGCSPMLTIEDSPSSYCFTILPVELLSFTGEAKPKQNVLSWVVSREENFSHYSVERSGIGTNDWQDLGAVAGAESGTEEQSEYTFTDADPLTQNYYRLRMVDLDGSFSYSPIVELNGVVDAASFSVFPNPNDGSFQLVLPEVEGELNLALYSLHGTRVRAQKISAGMVSWRMEDVLPSGIYLLSLTAANGERWTQRVVIR